MGVQVGAWHKSGARSQASASALLPLRLPAVSTSQAWGTPSHISMFPARPCGARGWGQWSLLLLLRPVCPEQRAGFPDCHPSPGTVGGGTDCSGCPARPLGSTFAHLPAQKVGSWGQKLLRLWTAPVDPPSSETLGQVQGPALVSEHVLLLDFGLLFGK